MRQPSQPRPRARYSPFQNLIDRFRAEGRTKGQAIRAAIEAAPEAHRRWLLDEVNRRG